LIIYFFYPANVQSLNIMYIKGVKNFIFLNINNTIAKQILLYISDGTEDSDLAQYILKDLTMNLGNVSKIMIFILMQQHR